MMYRKWHVSESTAAPGCGPLIDILWLSRLVFGVSDWKGSVCCSFLTSVGLSPPIGPQKGVLQPQVWPQHWHRHRDRPRCQKEDITVSQWTDLCDLNPQPTTPRNRVCFRIQAVMPDQKLSRCLECLCIA